VDTEGGDGADVCWGGACYLGANQFGGKLEPARDQENRSSIDKVGVPTLSCDILSTPACCLRPLVLPSSSGSGGELLAIPLVLASESIKARREEQSVAAEFGNDYEEYRRQTGFLIPGG
jgi:hypothetical protein